MRLKNRVNLKDMWLKFAKETGADTDTAMSIFYAGAISILLFLEDLSRPKLPWAGTNPSPVRLAILRLQDEAVPETDKHIIEENERTDGRP